MAKKVLYSVIGVVVLGFVLLLIIGLNMPPEQKPVATTVESVVATSTPTPSLDMKTVEAKLNEGTNYYARLFATGKETLGTHQYPNAMASLPAFDDDNSSVSRFGKFRTDTCLKNDPSAQAMNAYRDTSNLYTAANLNPPKALDDWSYDTNTLVSDICAWAGLGIDWEISKVTNSQLNAAEQKVTDDLTQVHKDIQSVTH